MVYQNDFKLSCMLFFTDYKKVFRSEWLKLKGSGMFWLTLIMAAFIPAIITLAGLLQSQSSITSVNTENAWQTMIRSTFQGFGGFFFPVFLTLVVIRLTQMEHRSGGWKLIETQPISKLSLYLGKFSIAVAVSLICIITLVLFSLAGGTLIMLVKSGSGFSSSTVPLEFILKLTLRLFIAGLGVLGIQYFFSVVISGFIGPFSIGLAATITGAILMGFGKALWWPYSAPGLTTGNSDGSATGHFLLYYEWLSLAWMTLALWLGYQWYNRRTFKRAFFKPVSRLVVVIIPAALFAVFFQYITKPVQLPFHNRTVISGMLETSENPRMAYLISEPLMDTILEIPVTENKIHFTTEKKIPPAVYILAAGRIPAQRIFFGNQDSLFFKLIHDGKSTKFTISGNRIPENMYLRSGGEMFDFAMQYLENFGYEMKPETFAKETFRLWTKETGRVENFRTADNLMPADDFISIQKKLISLKYRRLLDVRYAQWFRVYNPNDTLKFPEFVDKIRTAVSYTDSNLMSYEDYRDAVKEYFEKTKMLNQSSDTAYFNKVALEFSAGTIRDHLLYNRMKEMIGRTRDSLKREYILIRYTPFLSSVKMKRILLSQHFLLKSLHFGKPAPEIRATALNKDSVSLEDFKGRYVVIDVWATWCAPCKIQSPHFERLAEQYTSPDVAFVALSIDDSYWQWRSEAAGKSPRIMQLLSNNKTDLGKAYGIESIPRFMLLDPVGKIINAQMPYPEDPEFENILIREVKGLIR